MIPMEATQLSSKTAFLQAGFSHLSRADSTLDQGDRAQSLNRKKLNQATKGHECYKAEQMKLDLVILQ